MTSIDQLIKLHTGDLVYRADDPRHIGRVEAIHPTMTVTVKWQDTGWKELVDHRELKKEVPAALKTRGTFYTV